MQKIFRRIALNLDGAEESSHMGAPDFRLGGRTFAKLSSQGQGYGKRIKEQPQGRRTGSILACGWEGKMEILVQQRRQGSP